MNVASLTQHSSAVPDSLFTRTLDLTGEKEIPLDSPMVTPGILRLLQYISNTGDIPYISDPNIKRVLDYLGIDLPEVVYTPGYERFKQIYPNITTIDWNKEYKHILAMAVQTETPLLAQYLFNHTSPEVHQADEFQSIQSGA